MVTSAKSTRQNDAIARKHRVFLYVGFMAFIFFLCLYKGLVGL